MGGVGELKKQEGQWRRFVCYPYCKLSARAKISANIP